MQSFPNSPHLSAKRFSSFGRVSYKQMHALELIRGYEGPVPPENSSFFFFFKMAVSFIP